MKTVLMCRVCGEAEAIGSRLIAGSPAWVTDDFGRFNTDQQSCGRHIEERPLRQGERVISLEEAKQMVEDKLRGKVRQILESSVTSLLGEDRVREILRNP